MTTTTKNKRTRLIFQIPCSIVLVSIGLDELLVQQIVSALVVRRLLLTARQRVFQAQVALVKVIGNIDLSFIQYDSLSIHL